MSTDTKTDVIYAAILSGLDDQSVAKLGKISARSVAAYRAHVTMGTADAVKDVSSRDAFETVVPVQLTLSNLSPEQRKAIREGIPLKVKGFRIIR